jgi:hypothetical protein
MRQLPARQTPAITIAHRIRTRADARREAAESRELSPALAAAVAAQESLDALLDRQLGWAAAGPCDQPDELGLLSNPFRRNTEMPGVPELKDRLERAENNLPSEPAYLFRLEGTVWHVRYRHEVGFFKDVVGIRHICRLLARPHRPIPAVTLMGGDPSRTEGVRSFQPILEDDTRLDCARRLREVVEDLREAKEYNDVGSQERLQAEADALKELLEAAKNRHGRPRRLGTTDSERARLAVRNALDRAFRNLAKSRPPVPGLVDHLTSSIFAEGTSYVYSPRDPAPGWLT